MKTIIIGLPKSGRTTVAKELATACDLYYIHAEDWITASFRKKKATETIDDYKQELHSYYKERLKLNTNIIIDNINSSLISATNAFDSHNFIIEGLNSPRDFINLFNYNEDTVIFLNRTNGPNYVEGCDHINVNVVRDYCLWLANMGLLIKSNWLEFNFPIPGDPKDLFTKELGNKNTVTITRSIEKTIEIIKERYGTRIEGKES